MNRHDYVKNSCFQKILRELLASAERITGLPLCINDDLNYLGLAEEKRMHSNSFCMFVKQDNHPKCIAFCRRHVDSIITSRTGGAELTCPFGGLQFVAPIFIDGMFVSTLFAGPHCYANDDKPVNMTKTRRRDMLNIVASLARDISASVSQKTDISSATATRYNKIISYVYENLQHGISIEGLATKLHLSASRASHCVKEVTGRDFTSLVNTIRKTRSVRLILSGNMSMAEIAIELGFCDQSHFSKFFKQNFGITPNKYRQKWVLTDH